MVSAVNLTNPDLGQPEVAITQTIGLRNWSKSALAWRSVPELGYNTPPNRVTTQKTNNMTSLLTEAPWFSPKGGPIRIPTTTGHTVLVDYLDPRLEDMARYGGLKVRDVYSWIAPLPDNTYLTHDFGVVDEAAARDCLDSGFYQLPDDWWEYALGTYQGQPVKAAKYPRHERGEVSQEELDTANVGELTAVESYEDRLERAFTEDMI